MTFSELGLDALKALLKVASVAAPGPIGKLAGIADDAINDAQSLWAKVAPLIHGNLDIPAEHILSAQEMCDRLNLMDQTPPSE